VLATWKSTMHPCAKNFKVKTLCEQEPLIQNLRDSLADESDPAATKAKVYALTGLVKDSTVRDDFLANKGMELLLSIFIKQGEEWDSTREKIALFVMDTFLDENMGAELGIWPPKQTTADMDSLRCTEPEVLSDACWKYHLEEQGQEQSWKDWQMHFSRLLAEARERDGAAEEVDSENGVGAKDEL
jgi:nucleotide exchange factor SIL1